MKITIFSHSMLVALLATPLVTTTETYTPYYLIRSSAQTELATSYLSDINYPANIPNSKRQVAA